MHFKIYVPIQKYVGRDVPNSRYLVSSDGNVYDTENNCFVKKGIHSKGYECVYILGKHFLIHRLVADNLMGNESNKPCVDHINGVKTDNTLSNLRFVTYKENNNNPITKERNLNNGATWSKDNLPPNTRAVYRIKGGEKIWFSSKEAAAKAIGRRNENGIKKCCDNMQEKSCGYYWEWA